MSAALHLSIPREWPPLADLPCRWCSEPSCDVLGLCDACDSEENLSLGIRFRRDDRGWWETVSVEPIDVRATPSQLSLFGGAS